MIELSTNINIDKSVDDVFKLMYDQIDNSNNINEDLYKIIEWKISDWKIKNGKKKKVEQLYIYVNELPAYLKAYTVENDNYIRIKRKYKVINYFKSNFITLLRMKLGSKNVFFFYRTNNI